MREKPEWAPIWLRCIECGEEWDDWQPCGVRVEVYVAVLQAYRCQVCNSGAERIVSRKAAIESGT